MDKKIYSDNVVILFPEDFITKIVDKFFRLKDTYDIAEASFAECHEKNTEAYPIVVLKLTNKQDANIVAFVYYVPETDVVKFVNGNFNYRVLDKRDIGHKVFLKHEKECLNGKIAVKDNRIVFRFRR